ncbi:hypothetical protein D9M71_595570 [compost metagenome]
MPITPSASAPTNSPNARTTWWAAPARSPRFAASTALKTENRLLARPIGSVTRTGNTIVRTSTAVVAMASPVSTLVCSVVVTCAAASLIAKLTSVS